METNNPASALRNILQLVMESGEPTVLAGWEYVLKASGDSLQFAQLHGEVVALYNRLYERLVALPGDLDGRTQYMQYLPAWYQAIAFRHHWSNTGQPASGIADPQVVSQLTGLASTFELHSLTTRTPSGLAIKKLKDSIAEWHQVLDDADFDEKLRNELRAHVNRLDLLLSNNLILGTEPVIEASKNLVGAAITAMGPSNPSLRKKIGKVLAGVVIFLAGANQAIGDVNGILEGVIDMRTEISELLDPPAIDQHKTPELESGTSENDENVIDAETVEDDPPESPAPEGEG